MTNYVVEKRDTKSSVWSPVNKFVVGTTIVVPKLQEGHDYEFRVMAENQFGRSEPLNTDKPTTARDSFGTPGKPGQPQVKEYDKDHIDIEWTRPSDDGGSPITHYDVERKDMKMGRWIKINNEPVKVWFWVSFIARSGRV